MGVSGESARAKSLICRPLFHIMLAAAGIAMSVPAMAVDQSPAASATDLKQLHDELEKQRKLLEEQQKVLQEQAKQLQLQQNVLTDQREQLDSLRAVFYGDGPRPVGSTSKAPSKLPVSYSTGRTAGDAGTSGVTRTQQPTPGTGQSTQGAAPQKQPEQRPELPQALVDEGGVLTPRGMVVIEPSFEYLTDNNNQFLVNGITVVPGVTIGNLDVRTVNTYTQTYALTGRAGITNRLEVDAKVPYVRSQNSTSAQALAGAGGGTFTSQTDGSGIGDIEAGVHYQVNDGTGGWPFFVGNLRYKARNGKDPFQVGVDPNNGLQTQQPVGTGFESWEPSVTAIFPSDPVVFFGNLKYLINVPRTVTLQPSPGTGNVPLTTRLDPGDGIGGSLGMGFGINERASFSTGFDFTHFKQSKQGGQAIAGSEFDVGSYNLGFSYRLTDSTSVNLGVAIGATKDAPDLRILFRVPVRLQVF
ncbi:MAG: hypothetical protein U1F33_04090 [Alphaproteobacteria bacterium]